MPSPALLAPIDTRSLAVATRRVFDRGAKLVGWGSGSVFDYFHGLYPVRLEYLVDDDQSRWGSWHHGLEVVSPARLARDADRETFVIIYSDAWPTIQQSIAEIGPIASVPASAVFADAGVRAKLAWAEEMVHEVPSRHVARADSAIVVQGPIVPEVTPHVLRVMSALHPRHLLILSTWTDTDPALMAEVGPLVDEVVASRRPDPPGVQNRNLQIVSTLAGIDRAIALGARTVLKTRTDLAVLNKYVFSEARWWLDHIGNQTVRAAGLHQRIMVPQSFTRKYLLYHPSDLVMLGDARDLRTYWATPLDSRSGSLTSPEWRDRAIADVNMDGHPSESYLGLNFCRSIGRATPGTLDDSWTFYRDFFVVTDNDWFDLLWFKNLSIPDTALRSGVRQTMSHTSWQRLQVDLRALVKTAADVDPTEVTFKALMGNGA